MDDQKAGQAILNVSTKLDRVIEAVAEGLAETIAGSLDDEAREEVILAAENIADRIARIDGTFNRAEFLNIANP